MPTIDEKCAYLYYTQGWVQHTDICLKKRLEDPAVALDLHEDGRRGHDVAREGGRPAPRLLDDVLEARVVQQQLRQDLRRGTGSNGQGRRKCATTQLANTNNSAERTTRTVVMLLQASLSLALQPGRSACHASPLNVFAQHIVTSSHDAYLLEDVHAVAEVGEVGEHVVVELLDACAPERREFSHERLDLRLVQGYGARPAARRALVHRLLRLHSYENKSSQTIGM